MALLPQLFRELGPDARTSLLGLFVFGLGAAASWTSRRVESESGFDVRGLRALHGTRILWAVLGLAHVGYWSSGHELRRAVLLPVAALLGARHLERERQVWALGLSVILATAVLLPVALSSVALMTAPVLVLHARRAVVQREAPQPELVSPYRRGSDAGASLDSARRGLDAGRRTSMRPRVSGARLRLSARLPGRRLSAAA